MQAGAMVGLLVELLLLAQGRQAVWLNLALGLLWLIVAQLRLFLISRPTWQVLTFCGDVAILAGLVLSLHQLSWLGLVLTMLGAVTVCRSGLVYGLINGAMLGLAAYQLVTTQASVAPLVAMALVAIWLWWARTQCLAHQESQGAQQAAMALALQDQMRAQEEDLFAIRQEYIQAERQRISRDLHDSVGHSLSTIIVQLGAIAKLSEQSNPTVTQMALQLKDFASQGLQEVRQVIHDLKPLNHTDQSLVEGLQALLDNVATNSSLKVDFRHNQATWDVDPIQYQALYRACQESIANAQKHGQASQVNLTLMFAEQELVLTIQDNGQGCQTIQPHMGLASLRRRLESLGGQVQFSSQVGQGFTTRLVLPRLKERN